MIALGLGSNLGERQQNIKNAILALQQANITVTAVSSLYETEPVGLVDQPAFLNAVVSVETTLTPQQLLEVCLGIEKDLGRVRLKRWGPRVIDIDILLYNDECIDEANLKVPHPLLQDRRFVLVPLAEISKGQTLLKGLTGKVLLDGTKDTSQVSLYGALE